MVDMSADHNLVPNRPNLLSGACNGIILGIAEAHVEDAMAYRSVVRRSRAGEWSYSIRHLAVRIFSTNE